MTREGSEPKTKQRHKCLKLKDTHTHTHKVNKGKEKKKSQVFLNPILCFRVGQTDSVYQYHISKSL